MLDRQNKSFAVFSFASILISVVLIRPKSQHYYDFFFLNWFISAVIKLFLLFEVLILPPLSKIDGIHASRPILISSIFIYFPDVFYQSAT